MKKEKELNPLELAKFCAEEFPHTWSQAVVRKILDELLFVKDPKDLEDKTKWVSKLKKEHAELVYYQLLNAFSQHLAVAKENVQRQNTIPLRY